MIVMKNSIFGLLVASIVSLVSGASYADAGRTETATNPERPAIVVGRISEDAKKQFSRLKVMADYLTKRLTGDNSQSGKAVVAPDLPEMIRQFRNDQVDIISETPFAALELAEKAGAEILLREWKKGIASYRTVFFFVRKDGPIRSLADLVGRKVAFEDEGSTSAFLVPMTVLRREGFDLVLLSSPRESPPPDKIGYAFARGELNMVSWVANGITPAGAFSNTDFEEALRTTERIKKDLQLLYSTEPIIRSVILVRGNIPIDRKIRIKDLLLKMHLDADGRDVLKAYSKVKGTSKNAFARSRWHCCCTPAS